ncbi:MAG: hypothetical protein ACLRX0_08575 [Collinsella aerofaciens]
MLDQAYSRRRFLGLAGGLASVGLGLVGCGGSGASDAAIVAPLLPSPSPAR